MNRRGMFSFLAALPLVGWLFSSKVIASAPQFKMVAGTLGIQSQPVLRVWTLGSLEHKLLPTKETIARLTKILQDWDHKSDLDLIWGPDLKVHEFMVNPADIEAIKALPNIKIDFDGNHLDTLTKEARSLVAKLTNEKIEELEFIAGGRLWKVGEIK